MGNSRNNAPLSPERAESATSDARNPAAGKSSRRAAIAFAIVSLLTIAGITALLGMGLTTCMRNDAEAKADKVPENLNQNIDPTQYAPFTSENIARLDGESTLSLPDDDALPRIDCAAALVPLTSAIATATYPQSATVASPYFTEGYLDGMATEQDKVCNIQYNNTTRGYQLLAEGCTDVFLGVKPDENQNRYASSLGNDFTCTPIGKEAFVFIVNADNPVDSLTIEQIQGIYSGRITNWSQLGGPNAKIKPYQRAEGSGSQSQMERFMGDTPLMDAPTYTVATMGGLVREVADYSDGAGSIGYSFRYYVTDLVGEYHVKLLAVEGVEPTLGNIENGSYPLTGEIVATTRADEANPEVSQLVEWIRSEQGQELVRKSGYAGLGT